MRPARVIGRRAALLAGAGLAARPAAAVAVPPGAALAFRLVRHGSDIGRHTLSFDRQGDALTVRAEVQALVSLLSVPIVRYSHHAIETWQGGKLAGLTGETVKNGQHEWVSARRNGEGLVVDGSRTARYMAPEAAIGTTYWNRRMVDGPMISLEDGVLLRPRIELHPAETIRLASGGMITADHYNLSGAFDADVWYDQTGTWASLGFDAADGSNIRYERL